METILDERIWGEPFNVAPLNLRVMDATFQVAFVDQDAGLYVQTDLGTQPFVPEKEVSVIQHVLGFMSI